MSGALARVAPRVMLFSGMNTLQAAILLTGSSRVSMSERRWPAGPLRDDAGVFSDRTGGGFGGTLAFGDAQAKAAGPQVAGKFPDRFVPRESGWQACEVVALRMAAPARQGAFSAKQDGRLEVVGDLGDDF